MIRFIPIIIISLVTISSYGQKDEFDFLEHHSVSLRTDSSKVQANILMDSKEVRFKNNKYYYSYKTGKIKRIKGGAAGNVLTGKYTESDFEDNILIQGYFKKGLKKGTWRKWYPSGELKEVITWHHGLQNGKFERFNAHGELVQKGFYVKGKLHGKVTNYQNGAVTNVTNYQMGKIVTKAEKPQKTSSEKEKEVESKS